MRDRDIACLCVGACAGSGRDAHQALCKLAKAAKANMTIDTATVLTLRWILMERVAGVS
jgi:hypothetical protein